MALIVWDKSGADLAELIRRGGDRHLVVISHVPSGYLNLDADWVAEETDGFADVVVIANGTSTYDLEGALPAGWQVFGNAARAYRADGQGPTQYVRPVNAGELRPKAAELVGLVQGLPLPDGMRKQVMTGPLPAVPAPVVRTGKVRGFVGRGELAWVDFPDGSSGMVRSGDVVPGVRLDWIMQAGLEVTGKFDPVSLVLSLKDAVAPARSAPAHYGWGKVVLGLVEAVGADSARISLLPNYSCEVRREDISSNPLDSVDELLTEGMVLPARLYQQGGIPRLSLIDVDDDEPVEEAPVLVAGGLPWLQLGRDLLPPSVDEILDAASAGNGRTAAAAPPPETPASARTGSAALHSVQLQLDKARAEIGKLREELAAQASDADLLARRESDLDAVRAELAAAAREADELRTAYRRQRELSMKAQMRARKAENGLRKEDRTVRERFATDEEAFRHELFLAWVDRVDPHDKPRYRLGGFAIGPRFLPSFRSHPEDQRAKALKALVDLLTGRKELMDKRNPHVLRQGRGAEEPPQVRARDGAVYWRMSVERNTAAARRVHYLKLPDGGLELHELVPHEVTQP